MLALGDFNHARCGHLPTTYIVVDLVLLEQKLDPLGHLLRDPARTLHHFREVEGDVLGGDAKRLRFLDFLIELRALQQRLRRNAAPVQARAPSALQLDTRDFFAELPGSNRARIARRTTTNDNEIVFDSFSHGANLPRSATPSNGFSCPQISMTSSGFFLTSGARTGGAPSAGASFRGTAAFRVNRLKIKFVTLTTNAPHTAGQNPAT